MRMSKSAFWLMGLCVLLSLTCAPDIEFFDFPEASVVGRWTKRHIEGDDRTLTLENDNSYELGFAGSSIPPKVFGNYSIRNNQVSFSDVGGPGACSENPGVYKFDIGGGLFAPNASVTFTLVSDACSGRSSEISGSWQK